jgi:hypothetical protein
MPGASVPAELGSQSEAGRVVSRSANHPQHRCTPSSPIQGHPAIREDVPIGRYVTSETIRLGISGLSAGLVVGLVWRAAGRTHWGAAPFVVTVLAAAGLTGRFDSPRGSAMVAVGAIVMTLAGVGAAHLLADPATHWGWVGAAALISSGGVWAGVPETGPALLAAGGIVGLTAIAGLTTARWVPAAGMGLAVVLGWAALSGSAGRPWAALGGALCAGVAPWFALPKPFPVPRRGLNTRPWLLGAHVVIVLLAARWIGVNPDAGWGRVAIVVFAGIVVAMATRRRA